MRYANESDEKYAIRLQKNDEPHIPATPTSPASPARAFWLVESPHPSYWRREGRVWAAVELAEQLMAHAHPSIGGEVDVEAVDVTVLDAAMDAAKQVYGKGGRAALDEWELEELEDEDDDGGDENGGGEEDDE